MNRCRVIEEELANDAEVVTSLFDVDADIDQRKESLINSSTGMPPFDIWCLMSRDEQESCGNGSIKWVDNQ